MVREVVVVMVQAIFFVVAVGVGIAAEVGTADGAIGATGVTP